MTSSPPYPSTASAPSATETPSDQTADGEDMPESELEKIEASIDDFWDWLTDQTKKIWGALVGGDSEDKDKEDTAG